MKKILLLLIALCMFIGTYGSNVIKVKPGSSLSLELVADTIKYPMLKGNLDKVTWFYTDGTNERDLTVSGNKYTIQSASISDKGYYCYKFNVNVTKSLYVDTVAYVHVYGKPIINKFFINNKYFSSSHVGDSAIVNIEVADKLDVDTLFLLDGRDTIIKTTALNFKFLPNWIGKDTVSLVAKNSYFKNDELIILRTLSVLPIVKIDKVTSEVKTGNKHVATLIENGIVEVTNHDSVAISFVTNEKEIKDLDPNANITYNWNYDGIALPSNAKTIGGKLIFNEYDKINNDGRYNVIINDGKYTVTGTVYIYSNFAVANESLITDKVYYSNGTLYANGDVVIYNTLGSLAFKGTVCNNINLLLPKGYYIVEVNNTSYKIYVK